MESLLNFLGSIYPLSEGLQEYLCRVVRYRRLKKKEFLLKAGRAQRCIFFIRSGLLRAFYEKDDREVSSAFLKEGDTIVSFDSFYGQEKSPEFIRAIEDSEVYYIGAQELEYIYREFTEFNFIGRVLAIRHLKSRTQQLYGIRMRSARERYQWLMRDCPEIVSRVPVKDIASYLDIGRETLTKIRRERMKV